MMEPAVTKHLLFEHFAGKSTPLQKKLIEEWLTSGPNRELFYEWLLEWECQSPPYLPELDTRFEQFAQHMAATPVGAATVEPELTPGHPYRRWLPWAIAASVLVCLGVLGWSKKEQLVYETYQTAFGEVRKVTLADGSRVTLNANSTLRVPRFGFRRLNREVLLTGEAEFVVSHTHDHRKFIVRTDRHFDVTVLGTEFTVYARAKKAKVVLNTGKVQLSYSDGKTVRQLLIKPGELVSLSQDNQLKREAVAHPEQHASWKEHRFVFEDTSLREFAELFRENYGTEIIINGDTLANRTLIGSFRAESADELLSIVCEAFGLTATRSGDGLILSEEK